VYSAPKNHFLGSPIPAPKAVLEGMATGLIPILPNVGELANINEAKIGIGYHEHNVESLHKAILTLLRAPITELSSASINASRFAKKFTWVKFCEKHEKFYHLA